MAPPAVGMRLITDNPTTPTLLEETSEGCAKLGNRIISHNNAGKKRRYNQTVLGQEGNIIM